MGFCIRVVKIFILRAFIFGNSSSQQSLLLCNTTLKYENYLVTLLENKYSSSDLSSFISYIIFKQMHDKLIYDLRIYSAAQF